MQRVARRARGYHRRRDDPPRGPRPRRRGEEGGLRRLQVDGRGTVRAPSVRSRTRPRALPRDNRPTTRHRRNGRDRLSRPLRGHGPGVLRVVVAAPRLDPGPRTGRGHRLSPSGGVGQRGSLHRSHRRRGPHPAHLFPVQRHRPDHGATHSGLASSPRRGRLALRPRPPGTPPGRRSRNPTPRALPPPQPDGPRPHRTAARPDRGPMHPLRRGHRLGRDSLRLRLSGSHPSADGHHPRGR